MNPSVLSIMDDLYVDEFFETIQYTDTHIRIRTTGLHVQEISWEDIVRVTLDRPTFFYGQIIVMLTDGSIVRSVEMDGNEAYYGYIDLPSRFRKIILPDERLWVYDMTLYTNYKKRKNT